MKRNIFLAGVGSFIVSLFTVPIVMPLVDGSLTLSLVISVCFAVLMGIVIYIAIATDNSYDTIEEIIEKKKKEAFGEELPKEGTVRKYLYEEPSDEYPCLAFIIEIECKNNNGESYILSFDIPFSSINAYAPGTVVELNCFKNEGVLFKINKLAE